MKLLFNFGKTINGYNYKVINEREARASAGIMFLLGLLSVFAVFQYRTIFWAELFSITFIIEFFIRVFINPQYAPYMLIAELIVHNQHPEWVEAKPKQFAWALGLVLGVIMTYFIITDTVSLIRLAICWICLFLMFVESVFGICLGCLLYKKLNWKLYNCPGGICQPTTQKYNPKHILLIVFFSLLFIGTYYLLKTTKYHETQKIIIIKNKK